MCTVHEKRDWSGHATQPDYLRIRFLNRSITCDRVRTNLESMQIIRAYQFISGHLWPVVLWTTLMLLRRQTHRFQLGVAKYISI